MRIKWCQQKNVKSASKKGDFCVKGKHENRDYRDVRVTWNAGKLPRFPRATGSPSAHSCLVPHPVAVIEHVVEESLA